MARNVTVEQKRGTLGANSGGGASMRRLTLDRALLDSKTEKLQAINSAAAGLCLYQKLKVDCRKPSASEDYCMKRDGLREPSGPIADSRGHRRKPTVLQVVSNLT